MAAACLGVAGLAASLFGGGPDTHLPSQGEGRSDAQEQTERDLYSAMDQHDPSKAEQAFAQVEGSDAGLRLAALRYLCASGQEADARLHALLDDAEPRVRRAAIQLLGAGAHRVPELQSRLRVIAKDPERELAERHLAKRALGAPE